MEHFGGVFGGETEGEVAEHVLANAVRFYADLRVQLGHTGDYYDF